MRKIIFIFLLIIILFLSSCIDNNKQSVTSQNNIIQTTVVEPSVAASPFMPDPITATIEYPDVNIYYENNQIIYSYNPKTKEKKKIVDGVWPSLAGNKKKLIYHVTSPNTVDSYLLSLDTWDRKKLPSIMGILEWSPDDRYVFIQFNAGIVAQDFGVLDISTNKIIDFMSSDELRYSHGWLNENELVFMEYIYNPKSSKDKFELYGYDKSDFNIVILDCVSGEKKTLRQSKNPKEDYRLIYVQNNKIFYNKLTVQNEKDWQKRGEAEVIHYIMDKQGTEISMKKDDEEIFNMCEDDENKKHQLYVTVEGQFPLDRDSYYTMQPTLLSFDKNWVLIELRDKAPQINGRLFLMNLNNSKSLIQIGEGNYAQW